MKSRATWLCGVCLCLGLIASNALAVTFTVTNTADSGTGSLRDALARARPQTYPGFDTIRFNIPGPGPHWIAVRSQLPPADDPAGLLIDGFTQPGSSVGSNPPATLNLKIVLDGTLAGAAHGLRSVTPNNTIRGLVIHSFAGDGVRIEGRPGGTDLNRVEYCFVGTDPTGLIALGNGLGGVGVPAGINIIVPPGVQGVARDNTVAYNLISGNFDVGVQLTDGEPGGGVYRNHVEHNYIGTDVTGMQSLANSVDGVCMHGEASDNAVTENVISGNGAMGVSITGYAQAQPPIYSSLNSVAANTIGVAADRMTPLPNGLDGVSIGVYGGGYFGGFACSSLIQDNLIAHNGRNGILVWEHGLNTANADSNRIDFNSIHSNQALGIDLGLDGVTPMDPSDPDTGANQGVNFPLIIAAALAAGQTTVVGWLDIDTYPPFAEVQVFKARLDPTGFGEGEVYLGSAVANQAGYWRIVVSGLAANDYVTATTIDRYNNTSEFAQCVTVISNLPPICDAGGPYWGRVNVPAQFDGTSSSDPDGTIVTYSWEFGDGAWGTGATPSHTYAAVGTYTVTLTVTDSSNCPSWCATTMTILPTTAIDDAAVGALTAFRLSQNRPNPFSSSTWIRYELPEATRVSLRVYDVSGRLVRVLVDGVHERAEHTARWDRRSDTGEVVAPGVYFMRLQAGEQRATRKMLVR